jgi:hypothetical protein
MNEQKRHARAYRHRGEDRRRVPEHEPGSDHEDERGAVPDQDEAHIGRVHEARPGEGALKIDPSVADRRERSGRYHRGRQPNIDPQGDDRQQGAGNKQR